MAQQLSFDLPVRTALGRGDFFVSPSNALALAALDAGNWPLGKMLLTGPEGSGKSHLARVWASEVGAGVIAAADLPEAPVEARALVVEDADRIAGDLDAETRLFHLHNRLLAHGGRLLLTARLPARQWGLALPDLASRMEATASAALLPPDDALLTAVLVKLFADRQIAPPPDLIPWAVRRMERSFAAARHLVTALDERALAEGRPIGQKLAAELLDKTGPAGA